MAFKHSGQSRPSYAITGFPLCSKAVTPHDTNELTNYDSETVAQTIVVYGAGDIVVVPAGNAAANTDTYTVSAAAADAGFTLPVLVRIVKSTGTTATVIKGYF